MPAVRTPQASRSGSTSAGPAAAAAGSRPPTRTQLSSTIRSLDCKALETLLLDAACTHPAVAQSITSHVAAERAAEASKVHDFDHYSKSAWYSLNKEYARMRCSRQFEVGHDVASSIERMFDTMVKQSPAHASYGTKRSAVETMRKICQSIVLADPSELAKVVRNNVYGLGAHMATVLKGFTAQELDRLVTEDGGSWPGKLDEAVKLAESYAIMDDLNEALVIIIAAVRRHRAAANINSNNNNNNSNNNGGGNDGNSNEDLRGEDGIDAQL